MVYYYINPILLATLYWIQRIKHVYRWECWSTHLFVGETVPRFLESRTVQQWLVFLYESLSACSLLFYPHCVQLNICFYNFVNNRNVYLICTLHEHNLVLLTPNEYYITLRVTLNGIVIKFVSFNFPIILPESVTTVMITTRKMIQYRQICFVTLCWPFIECNYLLWYFSIRSKMKNQKVDTILYQFRTCEIVHRAMLCFNLSLRRGILYLYLLIKLFPAMILAHPPSFTFIQRFVQNVDITKYVINLMPWQSHVFLELGRFLLPFTFSIIYSPDTLSSIYPF